MYKNHYAFELPENGNLKIWRYIDFEKFLSLITYTSLYFCRSDKLMDSFEGTIPQTTLKNLENYFNEFDNKDEITNSFYNLFSVNRKMTLV